MVAVSGPADMKRHGLETRNKDQDTDTHTHTHTHTLTHSHTHTLSHSHTVQHGYAHVHRIVYQQTTLSAVSALSCVLRGTPFQICHPVPTQLQIFQ